MEQYKNSDKLLSEKSKIINQLGWTKLMNNYKNKVEEMILKELIYVWKKDCKASSPLKFDLNICEYKLKFMS